MFMFMQFGLDHTLTTGVIRYKMHDISSLDYVFQYECF